MSTKSEPQAKENNTKADLAAFEELPEKKKKLMELKEQDENTIGSEQEATNRKIEKVLKKDQ